MSKPRLLMIGGWTDCIQKAVECGFDVTYFGDTNPSYWLDPQVLTACEHVQEVPMDQAALCLALARPLHTERPYAGVVSFTEYGIETSAILAEALGIKGLDPWPTAITRNKEWTRRVLDETADLALPWQPVSSPEDLEGFYNKYGPDVIVKPVTGAGSAGIHQIGSQAQLKEFISDGTWKSGGPYLVEQFIDGDAVYSAESLTLDGKHHIITFSMEKILGYPHSAVSYVMVPPPAPFDQEKRQRLAETTKGLLDAIGLTWGIAHTEMKIGSDGQIGIIESQTRIGGGRIYKMAELTTGFKQIDGLLQSLVSNDVSVPHLPESNSVGVLFRILAPAGTVRATADASTVEEMDGVFASMINIEPGQQLDEIIDNSDILKHGAIWFHVADHDIAFDRMRAICENYWVEYEDGTVWHPHF